MELLQFKAEWCGPCKTQSEMMEDFDAVPVRKIDIEEEQELANDYNVRSIPTMILQENGTVYESFNGVTEVNKIEEAVEEHQ